MAYKPKNDLYSLLHEVSVSMGRGPRQGLAVRPGQNKVLSILNKHDEMLQKELLEKLGIRAASLSELLRKLEKEEYVSRRRSGNGNEIIVSITEKGRISALECELSRKERDEALFSCLTDEERAVLIALLNKLLFTWREQDDETEGQRRERRWRENALFQDDERAANEIIEAALAGMKANK